MESFHQLWLQYGYSYKFVLQDASSNLVATYDNIAGLLTQIPSSAPTLPSGVIVIWSGSTGSIPSGFVLCDGTNSTPDLRNSFILGAGNNYTVGQTGGSTDAIIVSHTHTASSTSTVTDSGHSHALGGNYTNAGGSVANLSLQKLNALRELSQPTDISTTGITVATSTTNQSTGTSGTNANMPPYYALAFIMKS